MHPRLAQDDTNFGPEGDEGACGIDAGRARWC